MQAEASVGVTVWFGWGGVVWHPDTTPQHPSQAVLQPASACISLHQSRYRPGVVQRVPGS